MSILGARIKLTSWEKILLYITFTILIAILISIKINELESNKAKEVLEANEEYVNNVFDKYTTDTTNNTNTVNSNETKTNNTSKNDSLNNTTKKIESTYNENEKKAIELAKSEWGENDESVSFNISDYEDKIYHISVNNIQTTEVIAWYEVNIESGEVSDY